MKYDSEGFRRIRPDTPLEGMEYKQGNRTIQVTRSGPEARRVLIEAMEVERGG